MIALLDPGDKPRSPTATPMDVVTQADRRRWWHWLPTAAHALRAVRIASDVWWLARRGWALVVADPDLLDLFAGA